MNEMDKSAFLEILGNSPEIKAIDFLIEGKGLEYTKIDVAKACEISTPTLYKIWQHLERNGIVKPTRKLAGATLYKLNESNELVKALIEVDRILLKKTFEEIERWKKIKIKTRI